MTTSFYPSSFVSTAYRPGQSVAAGEAPPDIRVELRSADMVILECKWDGSANLLGSQLEEWLEDFPEALGMVGVLYPDGLRHEENTYAGLEAATDLQWWLHGGAQLGLARTQGQKRPGAVRGLDLGFLVHAQDQRPVRRVR